MFVLGFHQIPEHDVRRVLVNDGEIGLQPHFCGMAPDHGPDHGMEGADGHSPRVIRPWGVTVPIPVIIKGQRLPFPDGFQFSFQPFLQVIGSGTGERDQQDVPGLIFCQDPFRSGQDGRGLTRPRTGHPDHRRSDRGVNECLLLRIVSVTAQSRGVVLSRLRP